MKKMHLVGVSALAMIGWSAAAQAADTTGPDIIVTAAKRDQSLQSIPISVSVTNADTIQKAQIVDLIDLQSVVPSLKVIQLNNTSQTQFSIRGFADGNGNLGLENAVGLFIDGVYRSRSISSLDDLPDVERIEVLRGPQSTLFGKNVSVGAISITSKAPQFKWGGSAEATVGNYGEIQARASINAPLSQNVALKLSGGVDQRDGYFKDIVTGGNVNNRNRYSVRGDLLIQPSADLKIRIIADYSHTSEICCGVDNIYNGPSSAIIQGIGGQVSTPQNAAAHQVIYNFDPSNLIRNQGISGKIDYNVGGIKLTSITAYRTTQNDTSQDVDFSSADLFNNQVHDRLKTFTQEFRITSPDKGPFTWLVGGFYEHENVTTGRNVTFGNAAYNYANIASGGNINKLEALQFAAQNALFGAGAGPAPTIFPGKYYFQPGQGIQDNWTMTDESYSIFGQADWKPIAHLTLTGGAAYSHDNKAISSNIVMNDPFSATNFNNIPLLGVLPLTILNPLAPAGAKIPTNLFAALGQSALVAFYQNLPKPLNFTNPSAPNDINLPNASESGIVGGSKVTFTARAAYELAHNVNIYASYASGWKAASANLSSDSRPAGTLNGSRFDQPENIDVYEIGLKTKFHGGYANLTVFDEIAHNFQTNSFVGAGYYLTNAGKETVKGVELDSAYAPIKQLALGFNLTYLDAVYNSYTAGPCNGQNCAGGGTVDLSGVRPGGIPEWSITTSATWTQNLGHGYGAYVRGEWDYVSRTALDDNVPAYIGTTPVATAMVSHLNGAIGLETPYKLTVNLWVRNLTNQTYLLAGFPTVLQPGSYSGYPSAPRTWGLTMRKSF